MRRRAVFRALGMRLRGVRTFALVGRSGTGKSFRARLIAEKHGIDLLIDDGLLIRDRTILCGQTSKKEANLLSAMRRALFEEPGWSSEARRALRASSFRRALIIGTSVKMAARIASNLGLPRPSEIFFIEDIASAQEMDAARQGRSRRGAHALPLPPVKVRVGLRGTLESGARSLAATLAALRSGRPRPPAMVQAVDLTRKGDVVFTESAVGQMVLHCSKEFEPRMSMGTLRLTMRGNLLALEVPVTVPFQDTTSGELHELREYIIASLEKHAGVLVAEVRLVVEGIGEQESEGAERGRQ